MTINSGGKSLTTQSGLAYTAGARVRIASSATPSNYMEGIVTSYSGTTMGVTVDTVGGSGTIASWNINLAGNGGTPVYDASGNFQTSAHVVQGVVTQTTGNGVTVTLSGAAAFTSSSTYQCVASKSLTGSILVSYTSGTSVTFTGSNNDVIHYICVGN